MTDTLDELRIIAKDCQAMAMADRAVIARAADEFEQMQRTLGATNSALFEANQHRVALNDQIRDLRRQGAKLPKFPTISSGWMPLTVRNP